MNVESCQTSPRRAVTFGWSLKNLGRFQQGLAAVWKTPVQANTEYTGNDPMDARD